jgi:hypothetical protein
MANPNWTPGQSGNPNGRSTLPHFLTKSFAAKQTLPHFLTKSFAAKLGRQNPSTTDKQTVQMTFHGPETRGPGRPAGSRNRRTQEILDLLQGRGDKDPLDALSDIITKNQDPNIVATASNMLAPYLHSKRGTVPAPRFLSDPVVVPSFTSVTHAEDYLASIPVLLGRGELDSQSALELSTLTKNWLDAIYAHQEYDLKLLASNGGTDIAIRIEGGMPALPGTNINMAKEPSLNGFTNGNLIDHVDTPAIESVPSEGQEPEPNV